MVNKQKIGNFQQKSENFNQHFQKVSTCNLLIYDYCDILTELEGPCPNYITVLSNGHLYKMKPFTDSGDILSSQDIFR